MTTPSCPTCGHTIAQMTARIDPRACTYAMVAQCGHVIEPAIAGDLWKRGYRWTIPLIDGATLVGAERARQVTEEGYTPEHDASHDSGLAWAAWAYIDRAMNPTDGAAGPPTAWPWDEESWNSHATPLRHLVIAGALIAAEIDRRLLAARTEGTRDAGHR